MDTIKRALLFMMRALVVVLLVAFGLVILVLALGLPQEGLAWLAGGNEVPGAMSLLFLFWPASLLITMITLSFDYRRDYDWETDDRRFWGKASFWKPGWITSTWLGFFFLPIIMNGMSKLLQVVGWETASQMVFKYRWVARPMVVLGFLVLLILFMFVGGLLDKLKRIVARSVI